MRPILITFDEWDLEPPRYQHSYLYSLEPVGIGTADVESLTSYMARLAHAHCVSPAALFGRVIAPLSNRPYLSYPRTGPQTVVGVLSNSLRAGIRAFNGIGKTAKD